MNQKTTVVVFVFLACVLSLATAQPVPELAEKVLAATVSLEMLDKNGDTLGYGSGFFVRSNLVATNFHVIDKAVRGRVKLVNTERTYSTKGFIADDEANDLALIEVEVYGITPLPLGDSDAVRIGETVYVAGNPMGLQGAFSDGVISGIRVNNAYNGKQFQMTVPISPGISGGPVLNTRGEVIGVAVSSVIGGQNLSFAVPSNYLNLLIGSTGKRTPKQMTEGKQSMSAEAEFYFLSGMTRRQQLGQYNAAIENYDTAIRLRPDYTEAYYNRGIAKHKLGRYTAAVEDYDTAIRLRPDYTEVYYNRGIAKRKLGRYTAAIEDYDTAIQLKT